MPIRQWLGVVGSTTIGAAPSQRKDKIVFKQFAATIATVAILTGPPWDSNRGQSD